MIKNEDISTMRVLLAKAFPGIEEDKREEMLSKLVNGHTDATLFCVMNDIHIARLGVRYSIGEKSKGCYYYVTKYDNDMLDL